MIFSPKARQTFPLLIRTSLVFVLNVSSSFCSINYTIIFKSHIYLKSWFNKSSNPFNTLSTKKRLLPSSYSHLLYFILHVLHCYYRTICWIQNLFFILHSWYFNENVLFLSIKLKIKVSYIVKMRHVWVQTPKIQHNTNSFQDMFPIHLTFTTHLLISR